MNSITKPSQKLVLLTRLFNEDEALTESIKLMQEEPDTKIEVVDSQKMNSEDWDNLLKQVLSTPKVITL